MIVVEGSIAFQWKGMTETRVIVLGEQVINDVQTNMIDVKKVDARISPYGLIGNGL